MLSPKFEEALVFAVRLHSNQKRKVSNTPFVLHLLNVCAIILEDGGTEDEAIAGLLHDAVEDQGGLETLENIKSNFGEVIAQIVMECSETHLTPKPPWEERKVNSIAKMKNVSGSAIRVILADKIHNVQSIIREYQKYGKPIWDSFKGGREGTIWYYKEVLAVLASRTESHLITELKLTVEHLEKLK
jgi:(p)ppGpp synthase/HD superfamily hydrolase